MPLTDAAIKKATPSEKPFKKYDAKGLYLQIMPSGSKRWRFDYQHGGKRKTISLGTYPLVKLKQARDARDDAKRLLIDGIDPSQARQERKDAEQTGDSFETVARDWFDRQKPNWAESHSSKVINRLENDVFPLLGDRPISEVTAPELLKVLRKIEDRGAVESAHRVRTTCGT
jgi:hypothetical protein